MHLRSRGEASSSAAPCSAELQAQFLTYLTSIFYATNSPGSVGEAACTKLRTLADALDALLRGEVAGAVAGDILVQRFKAVELISQGGSVTLARQHQLISRRPVGFISEAESALTARQEFQRGRLQALAQQAGASSPAAGPQR